MQCLGPQHLSPTVVKHRVGYILLWVVGPPVAQESLLCFRKEWISQRINNLWYCIGKHETEMSLAFTTGQRSKPDRKNSRFTSTVYKNPLNLTMTILHKKLRQTPNQEIKHRKTLVEKI